jgi:hypothetical protein
VDVIGQHHHGVDGKRVARLRELCRLAQRVDMVRQKAAAPVHRLTVKNQHPPGMKARR